LQGEIRIEVCCNNLSQQPVFVIPAGTVAGTRSGRASSTIRRHVAPDIEASLATTWLPLELLATSRIVSLHVPLTAETAKLIGAAQLAPMPRGAYLVNTSHGGLVDEAAPREAIVSGHLAGAGLV
jgi:lactate dehydrogenase-like 2-hydroxyacid dehydrogenase